jgi:hypothetical protein
LEYSEIDHKWKVRYIPVDSVTDQYGGSVVLTNTALLSGHERGQFVEVRGKLVPAGPDRRGYSPDFEVQAIQAIKN